MDEVLDTQGFAERARVSVSKAEKLRVYGGGPPFIVVSDGTVF